MDGLLPIWKPEGLSSFDVIREVKHKLLKQLPGKVMIGHAGTLDPFAEGVLMVMLGKATKRFDEIMCWGKTYRAVAKIGAYSDTLDRTGKIELRGLNYELWNKNKSQIGEATKNFVGVIEQVVPQYSAAKYKGKPLYLYARKGIETPIKSKKVTIYSLEINDIRDDEVEFTVACSSGTYIRQLSYDLLKSLGIESYLVRLIREKVGNVGQEQCLSLSKVENADMAKSHLLPDGDES